MNFFMGVHRLFPRDLVSVPEIHAAAHKPAQARAPGNRSKETGSSSSPRVHVRLYILSTSPTNPVWAEPVPREKQYSP